MTIQGLGAYVRPLRNKISHIQFIKKGRPIIDVSIVMKRFLSSSSTNLIQGIQDNKFIERCFEYIQMISLRSMMTYVVFDGAKLPVKGLTHLKRANIRDKSLKTAIEQIAQDQLNPHTANASLSITSSMVHELHEKLKSLDNVIKIISPYEADATIAAIFLGESELFDELVQVDEVDEVDTVTKSDDSISEIEEEEEEEEEKDRMEIEKPKPQERRPTNKYVVTTDTDVFLYGCRNVFLLESKANPDFYLGSMVTLDSLLDLLSQDVGFTCTRYDLISVAILAGCDYCPNIPGIQWTTAVKILKTHGNIANLLYQIDTGKIEVAFKEKMPKDYSFKFAKAFMTFLFQPVYRPGRRRHEFLNSFKSIFANPELTKNDKRTMNFIFLQSQLMDHDFSFLGKLQEPELAYQIAKGEIDPRTHKPYFVEKPQNLLQRKSKTMTMTMTTDDKNGESQNQLNQRRKKSEEPILTDKNLQTIYFHEIPKTYIQVKTVQKKVPVQQPQTGEPPTHKFLMWKGKVESLIKTIDKLEQKKPTTKNTKELEEAKAKLELLKNSVPN